MKLHNQIFLTSLFFIFWQSVCFSQNLLIQVNIEADNLQAEIKLLKVICDVTDGRQSVQGTLILNDLAIRTHRVVSVPVNLPDNLSHYKSVNCMIHMCQSHNDCKSPKANTLKYLPDERYYIYDNTKANNLKSGQALNASELTSHTVLRTAITGENHNTTATIAPETTLSELPTERPSLAAADPVATANSDQVSLTINKTGNSTGIILPMINEQSIPAICQIDCSTMTFDDITKGSNIKLVATAQNVTHHIHGDDNSTFMGWSGDPVCSANSNANETTFPIDEDITCEANFSLVPPEQATVTLTRLEGDGEGTLIADWESVNENGVQLLHRIAHCPPGCDSVTSAPVPVGAVIRLTKIAVNNFSESPSLWEGDSICNEYSHGFMLARDTTCSTAFSLKNTGPTLTIRKSGNEDSMALVYLRERSRYVSDDFITIRHRLPTCDSGCNELVINPLILGMQRALIADSGIATSLKFIIGFKNWDDSLSNGDITCDTDFEIRNYNNVYGLSQVSVNLTQDILCTVTFERQPTEPDNTSDSTNDTHSNDSAPTGGMPFPDIQKDVPEFIFRGDGLDISQ